MSVHLSEALKGGATYLFMLLYTHDFHFIFPRENHLIGPLPVFLEHGALPYM
jgi:hypothetical protein